MSECFRDFFIFNGGVKPLPEFELLRPQEGKSVYEVLRLIKGVPLFLEKHLERLRNSCSLIGAPLLLEEEAIKSSINRLAEENKVQEGNVKIVFNYGNSVNTVLFYFLRHSYPTAEQYEKGVNTVLYHGERDNPNAKVINADFRARVEEIIGREKAYEAILVDRSGYVTEGSKSNIFMVKGNSVFTSPLEAVLPGVTRGSIIEILKDEGIEVWEEKVNFKDLEQMDGLFMTGTSPKVLPIKQVDSLRFLSGSNEMVKRIMEEYDRRIESYVVANLKK